MNPVESAVGVVTTPLERVWNGVVNFDEVERENQALQDERDRLIGTQAAAEAAVLQAQEILALNNLPTLAGIDTELAQVIGGAANNIDQVIEINKGRSSGIAVGMPVVNQAGLVGKVTSVTDTTARVMLITDTRYAVGVTVTAAADAATDDATRGRHGGERRHGDHVALGPHPRRDRAGGHDDDLHDHHHDGPRRRRATEWPADAGHDVARRRRRATPELRRPGDRRAAHP